MQINIDKAAKILHSKALAALHAGDFEDAIEYCKQGLDISPHVTSEIITLLSEVLQDSENNLVYEIDMLTAEAKTAYDEKEYIKAEKIYLKILQYKTLKPGKKWEIEKLYQKIDSKRMKRGKNIVIITVFLSFLLVVVLFLLYIFLYNSNNIQISINATSTVPITTIPPTLTLVTSIATSTKMPTSTITPIPTILNAPTSTIIPKRRYGVVVVEALRLRTGPGINNPIKNGKDRLGMKAEVEILSLQSGDYADCPSGKWYEVRLRDRQTQGFLCADYVYVPDEPR